MQPNGNAVHCTWHQRFVASERSPKAFNFPRTNWAHSAKTGTDRIELYTEAFAKEYPNNPEAAIKDYYETSLKATEFGLGINAGHDLSLDNLKYFSDNIPNLLEVSIGHALISDALYFGLENTIKQYKDQLR